jgi:hypothetical protein
MYRKDDARFFTQPCNTPIKRAGNVAVYAKLFMGFT